MAKFLPLLFATLLSLHAVSSSPLTIPIPEVIPGNDLPSLASLNLTSTILAAIPLPKSTPSHKTAAPFDARCGPVDSAYTNVRDIVSCYHYLNKLGEQACKIGPGEESYVFCQAGDAAVTGLSVRKGDEDSYCSDVALGLLWILDHCTRPDKSVAGYTAANGNENLIVGGTNLRYSQS